MPRKEKKDAAVSGIERPEGVYRDEQGDLRSVVDSEDFNPFKNQTMKMNAYEWFKVVLMTVTLIAPLRIIGLAFFSLSIAFIAHLSLIGVDKKKYDQPISKWRVNLNWICQGVLARCFIFCFGVVWMDTSKEKYASREEAPIVVCNHHGMIDSSFMFYRTWPHFIVKREVLNIPGVGGAVRGTRPLIVDQGGDNSHLKEKILQRTSAPGYRQIGIFPEGTTANGTALLEFMPGAFLAGVPVQPMCIYSPHKYFDTVFTTDIGAGLGWHVYRIVCQFYNTFRCETLPVYVPNEAEKADSYLYAENVRRAMSRHMQIPMSNANFADMTLIRRTRKKGQTVSEHDAVIGQVTLRDNCGVGSSVISSWLDMFSAMDTTKRGTLDHADLARSLHLPDGSLLNAVFDRLNHFNQKGTSELTFRSFVKAMASAYHSKKEVDATTSALHANLSPQNKPLDRSAFDKRVKEAVPDCSDDTLSTMFAASDVDGDGVISQEDLKKLLEKDRRYFFVYDCL